MTKVGIELLGQLKNCLLQHMISQFTKNEDFELTRLADLEALAWCPPFSLWPMSPGQPC